MTAALAISRSSARDLVSTEEWKTRVDLAACYRLIAKFGMTDLIYNHITAPVPGEEGHFLINPFGMMYEEITASGLIKINLQGEIVFRPDDAYDVNYAGFVIHSAVHAARPDAGCVIHTHTRAGVAVSAMQCGLLPISQPSLIFYDRVGYHDYEGPAVNTEERVRLAENLGARNVLLLRNHGVLVVGVSIAQAFVLHYQFENACKIQVDALASRTDLTMPAPALCESVVKMVDENPHLLQDARREWAALLRKLDRESPGYSD